MNKKDNYKTINKFVYDKKEERELKLADIIARIINARIHNIQTN